MDPIQALNLLDQIVMNVPLPRAKHLQALVASTTIRNALTPKEESGGDNA